MFFFNFTDSFKVACLHFLHGPNGGNLMWRTTNVIFYLLYSISALISVRHPLVEVKP